MVSLGKQYSFAPYKNNRFYSFNNLSPHGCSVSLHPIITHDARDATAKLISASGILQYPVENKKNKREPCKAMVPCVTLTLYLKLVAKRQMYFKNSAHHV